MGGPQDPDVAAFDVRAQHYEDGSHGRLHRDIAERTATLVRRVASRPQSVLDVGCGTGYLLRRLAAVLPDAGVLSGVDPAPAMVDVARRAAGDARISFQQGFSEALPWPDAAFDLVVSTTSFDHWSDQAKGLQECCRVLRPGGTLVLVDLISRMLWPTLLLPRYAHKARTPPRVERLLRDAGLSRVDWHRVYALIINAATARKA
jgi:ubiquinone/menaquinone biosynthesis C-methylase UbiE